MPLTAAELRRVRLSVAMVTALGTVSLLAGAGFLWTLEFGHTWAEQVFVAAVAIVIVGCVLCLCHLTRDVWKDLRMRSKFVLRGPVESVERQVRHGGLTWTVRVAGLAVSDPLFPPAPGLLNDIAVGDPIEVSFLSGSGRSLRIVRL